MKFAPIIPYPDDADLMSLSSYHLLIATEVFRNLQDWTRKARLWRKRGDFIILDNGAPEEGAMPLNLLLEIAEDIRPDEIVLPDVIDDSEATLQVLGDNYCAIRRIPERQRFFVPQGLSLDERVDCLKRAPFRFGTLGIPKRSKVNIHGSRVNAVKPFIEGNWNIHLLGFLGNPLTELEQVRAIAHRIRGVDSAAPAAFAQHEAWIDVHRDQSFSVDLASPLTPHQSQHASAMIRGIQEVCDAL